ncbi:putative membrane protein [Arcanobacterium wilhelmae]|uniref:Membrane protein n=1 Tax=Arcanobacterium wilhelmae TaxID=1803177 RepID=A0ABT9NBQ1_9ACTO|nr:hypothetical protein [Arcanobacterium wilhelmae]MDP9801147.1 putative membrane protein [Arcanobacterium wilhelmae]
MSTTPNPGDQPAQPQYPAQPGQPQYPAQPGQPQYPAQPGQPQYQAPAQPQYQQPYPGQPVQQPVQPYPGQPQYVAPAAPGKVGVFFQTFLGSLRHIWQGAALQGVASVIQPKYGLAVLGVYTGALAFLFSILIGRSATIGAGLVSMFGGMFGAPTSQLNRIADSYIPYFLLSFGQWFGILAILLVGIALIFVIRIACLMIVFARRGSRSNFLRLATLFGYNVSPVIVALPVVLLVALIPSAGMNGFLMPVFFFVLSFAGLLAEFLTYVSVSREGRFQKSAALPYVASYALFTLGQSFVIWAMLKIMFEIMRPF